MYIGVDVSKNWIDYYVPNGKHARIASTPEELSKFAQYVRNLESETQPIVVMEATGFYDESLRLALGDHNVAYNRVQPGRARFFAKANGLLAKTDKVDAKMLHRMGEQQQLEPNAVDDQHRLALNAVQQRRNALVEMRKMEKTRLQQTRHELSRRSIEVVITTFDEQIKLLEAEIQTLRLSSPSLQKTYERLITAPGVGPVVATELLCCLPQLGSISRRKIASLGGLAPHANESGKRQGRRSIYGGIPRVRTAMYIAAQHAMRITPHFKDFAEKLKAKGLSYKQCVIAVARRLLVQLNAMIKKDQNYRIPL